MRRRQCRRSAIGHAGRQNSALLRKIANLILVKFSTLDSKQLGIEMECEKPGWNDAMNGLPGLFASGLSETVELLRLVEYALSHLSPFPDGAMPFLSEHREDLSSCWELVRFCSELNTTVVGGASKLLSSFIETYNPLRIRSFSDRSHTRGTLYEKLGFTEIRRSDPGYVWVNLSTDVAYHRVNAQKQHLKKFLNDDNIDLNKTENEIMTEHNFVQVFDSGTITWEWENTTDR